MKRFLRTPLCCLLSFGIELAILLLFNISVTSANEILDQSSETFTDPFAYCAAVGTIDAPDAGYTGPQMPESVARGLKQAFEAPPDAPLEPFLQNSFWRCMDGEVYACTGGANLPCQEKADTSKTPNNGMIEFCRSDPNADVIPAFASGRATIYEWRCASGTPTVVREVTKPDARGFLSNVWYEIKPE